MAGTTIVISWLIPLKRRILRRDDEKAMMGNRGNVRAHIVKRSLEEDPLQRTAAPFRELGMERNGGMTQS
ncbi:MAG: hypothetical protein JXA20_19080 [Spirochaetes bacterium]|nr:hypothetical protein [Spirochaetota bacterium]